MTKALTVGAFGARGTGKTAWVLQLLKAEKPARLIVWDFKHDPAQVNLGKPVESMTAFVRALAAPSFALRYQVQHQGDIHAQFDLFCRAAWIAGNLTMMVDELPEVTKANKAPASWRRCVNVGRDYVGDDGKRRALSIIGAGQRPAECDKSFISNCDVIHTGRLANLADADAMARTIGCKTSEITGMPDLAWIERRAGQVEFLRGTLKFRNVRQAQPGKPKGES